MLDIVNEVHAPGAYRVSVLVEKRQILREFGSITGYHRNSACTARLSSCPAPSRSSVSALRTEPGF